MTKELQKYIKEWKFHKEVNTQNSSEEFWRDKELASIQEAIRVIAKKEEDTLTEEEKKLVDEITSVDFGL